MGTNAERRELNTNRSLSLISAKPRILNPGMLSVELAFERVIARNSLAFEVKRYCLEEQDRLEITETGVHFHNLRTSYGEALAADRILYWGDFLHAWNYAVFDVLPEIKRDPDFAREVVGRKDREIAGLLRKYLLLSEAGEDVLAKTLSFGTTLLGDHALIQAIDPGYVADLQRFIRACRGLWTRDVISALRVAHFGGDYARSHLGVDCALLLSRDDLAAAAQGYSPLSQSPYAAVQFGRTTVHYPQTLEFARRLCLRRGLAPKWLSWLHAKPEYFRQFRSTFPELDSSMPQDPPYGDLLAGLLGASLVITDTYHLSLLAWRAGVPVVCVGAGAELPTRTISDKKKEIFHQMYGASPFYLFAESLADPKQRLNKLQMMNDAIGAQDARNQVGEALARHAAAAEKALVDALGA